MVTILRNTRHGSQGVNATRSSPFVSETGPLPTKSPDDHVGESPTLIRPSPKRARDHFLDDAWSMNLHHFNLGHSGSTWASLGEEPALYCVGLEGRSGFMGETLLPLELGTAGFEPVDYSLVLVLVLATTTPTYPVGRRSKSPSLFRFFSAAVSFFHISAPDILDRGSDPNCDLSPEVLVFIRWSRILTHPSPQGNAATTGLSRRELTFSQTLLTHKYILWATSRKSTTEMPRPGLPPTPSSSSDIKGKDGIQQLASFQLSFELPPPAIHDASGTSPATSSSRVSPTDTRSHPLATTSPEATFPMQPAETVKARRRSSVAKESKESTFALPPPPTRSRKIIQMKPRGQEDSGDSVAGKEKTKTAGKASAKTAAAATSSKTATTTTTGDSATDDKGKKKQPSTTSAAGRKIARKTAHSLIERRRRSKMNEEFAVLKDMIPACTGDMHKLSILQASIEYIRYLEDCVGKLKAQQEGDIAQPESGRATPTARDRLPSIREFHPTFRDDTGGSVDGDIEMEDSDVTSPAITAMPDQNNRHPSISPALPPRDARHRQHSCSSVSTDQRRYSYSVSAGTSPAFGPQVFGVATHSRGDVSAPISALSSPALDPQSELDQEAMAALLMLNHDRRDSKGRGLSVHDLLST
ncbi:hypothetical protein FZEAL_3321 [Fusarium zealandicum]|uniref:BHLH domain-containing protein n=1 Tax=Fusarium zealandicum TaxID=1053134 RepID=A0A8H4UNW2_9HYPO|nr:hypothetical protein FZEAL_3321 [Fusarium zealandicum]